MNGELTYAAPSNAPGRGVRADQPALACGATRERMHSQLIITPGVELFAFVRAAWQGLRLWRIETGKSGAALGFVTRAGSTRARGIQARQD